MRITAPKLVVVFLLATVTLVWLWRNGRSSPVALPAAAHAATLDRKAAIELQRKLAKVSERLAELQATVGDAPQPAVAPRVPLPAASEPNARSTVQAVEPSEEERQQRRQNAEADRQILRERLDERLAMEPRDPQWAQATEQQLKASLEAFAQRTATLSELRCQSSFCRVILSHLDATQQNEAMQALAGTDGFSMPGMAHLEQDAGGRAVTYVYLARGGEVSAQELFAGE